MRIGYFMARTNEFRGNCIRLAGKAEMLWRKHGTLDVSPRKVDGARIVELDDGTVLKQLLMQDASGELRFLDVE